MLENSGGQAGKALFINADGSLIDKELKMNKLYYSIDGEKFEECLDDIITEFISNNENSLGSIITVNTCVSYSHKASEFFPSSYEIIETLNEMAYDNNGEFAEDWLKVVSDEARNELKSKISEVIDMWAKKHNHEPTFFSIKDVNQIKIAIADNGDWEELK